MTERQVKEDIILNLDIGLGCEFELDNLDWAELVEGDEGVMVENEHGTQFSISELSDQELDLILGILDIDISTIRPTEYTNKQTKLREILIKYGNKEHGDCILDEICQLFNHPLTPEE